METPLQKAVAAAIRLFSTKNVSNICHDNLSDISKHLNNITKAELKLDPSLLSERVPTQSQDGRPPVTYIRVLESQLLTVCMFIVRQGKHLPLHDHPGMCGFLKVVHGSVTIKHYSSLRPESSPVPGKVQELINHKYGKDVPTCAVSYNGSQTVSEFDKCCVLTPENSNIHEVIAENGTAAFLDILAPPYDHGTVSRRPCTYFMAAQNNAESDSVHYLIPIEPPADYWCDEAAYCGPTLPSV